jgi:hypothetical protein
MSVVRILSQLRWTFSTTHILTSRHTLLSPVLEHFPISLIQCFIVSTISGDQPASQIAFGQLVLATAVTGGQPLVASLDRSMRSKGIQMLERLIVEHCIRGIVEVDGGADEFMVADLLAGVPWRMLVEWT